MKIRPDAHRREWSRCQQLLRRRLMIEQDYAGALPLFLSQQAAMHTARLQPGAHWSYQDEVLNGLAEAHLRLIPRGAHHSVVWALWHITRIEDVTFNVLLADAPQLLHSGGWLAWLNAPTESVGNEMTFDEIAGLSETLHVKALLAYRLAVGKRTRAIARRLKPESLWSAPAPERLQRLGAEGAVKEDAAWLLKYWGGHPGANLLLMPATRHSFGHLTEIQRLLPRLRRLSAAE